MSGPLPQELHQLLHYRLLLLPLPSSSPRPRLLDFTLGCLSLRSAGKIAQALTEAATLRGSLPSQATQTRAQSL